MNMGINLEKIIKPQIQTIVPKQLCSIHIYNGQTVDANGIAFVDYSILLNIRAQVELSKDQDLQFINNFNITKVYKDFWIQSRDLTGLNRNLSTGGDYIKMHYNDLYYRIVKVHENFLVGWVHVTGEESTSIESS